MNAELGGLFLDCSARRLEQLASRIETVLERLSYDEVWVRRSNKENAIGNLVLHLCGNMRQWIGHGLGGQPDIREREGEFAARAGIQPAVLAENLKTTVAEAVATIRELPPERLLERATVQAYTVTLLEAIYHVVEHFSQHTGQIIFAAKQMTGCDFGFYRHLGTAAPHGQRTP